MAGTFELEIATPERLLAREQATEAQIPAKNGYIGVLPEHAPLLSELGAGRLSFTTGDGKQMVLVVRGGFVEVLPDHVRVLTDRAELATEIDVAQAQETVKNAEQRVNDLQRGFQTVENAEYPLYEIDDALENLMHAQARLEVAQQK